MRKSSARPRQFLNRRGAEKFNPVRECGPGFCKNLPLIILV